jgi:hypothetical protein
MADNKQVEAVFAQALAAVQLQSQRDMAEKMIGLCFERCVTVPDARLTDKQRRCLDACAGAFLEGYQVAVRAEVVRGRVSSRTGGGCRHCQSCSQRTFAQSSRLPHRRPPPQAETLSSIAKKQASTKE